MTLPTPSYSDYRRDKITKLKPNMTSSRSTQCTLLQCNKMVNPQDNIVDLQDQDQGNQVNKQQILEWGHLTQLWHSWSNRARCLNCSDKRQKTLFQRSTSSATLMTLSGQTAGVTLSHTVTLSMGHGQKMALLSGWHAGLASQPAHLDKSETEFQKQFEVQHNDKLIINTMVIIKESFRPYRNKVEAPPNDANYLTTSAKNVQNDTVNNLTQFF